MRNRHDPKIDRFANVSILAGCGPRELTRVAAVADEVNARRGMHLMDQDRKGDHCYVVLDGTVEVRIDGHPVAEVGPGEIVGELSLIDREPRSASVVAKTDVRLAAISASDFDALIESVPGFRRGILRLIGRRFRKLDRTVAVSA